MQKRGWKVERDETRTWDPRAGHFERQSFWRHALLPQEDRPSWGEVFHDPFSICLLEPAPAAQHLYRPAAPAHPGACLRCSVPESAAGSQVSRVHSAFQEALT